jgi:ribonuclease P protein component
VAAGARRLLKKHRLSGPAAYRKVFSGSIRSTDSQFLVLATQNQLAYPRLGLAVSRKKLKTAVVRNLVKRMIRESFRHNRESLGSLDLVVMPQGSIVAGDRRRLRESLERHFKKVSKCRNS